jgi:Tfp pilus assembly protein PilO
MNKMRQWSLLTAVVVFVVFAAGWFLLVSKQNHKAASLRTQAAGVQASNAQLQQQVSQLQQQKKGLPAQQRKLAKFATEIPDNPELPTLIRQMSAAAQSAGVDLISLAPGQPAPVAVTASAPVAAGAAAAPAAPLDSITMQIHVTGSYYNVESFFAEIQKLTRAMMVSGWTLTKTNSNDTTSSSTSSTSSSSSTTTSSTTSTTAPGTLDATLTGVVYESPAVVAPTAVTPSAPASAH